MREGGGDQAGKERRKLRATERERDGEEGRGGLREETLLCTGMPVRMIAPLG